MNRTFALLTAAVWAVCGCTSNHDFKAADFSGKVYKKGGPGPQLKENEVLGLNPSGKVTDEDIRRILDETRTLQIRAGGSLMLVQSGARHPDAAMVEQLAQHFIVVPYTGVPSELSSEENSESISKALRLAAAHSKADTILVFWGTLEMKRNDLPTGIVSWVPVVDFVVPDEYQKTRMYLKVALIDVRSGQWATFRTEPIEEEGLTTRYAREHDQKWPLHSLRERLYQASVRKLMDGYVLASN